MTTTATDEWTELVNSPEMSLRVIPETGCQYSDNPCLACDLPKCILEISETYRGQNFLRRIRTWPMIEAIGKSRESASTLGKKYGIATRSVFRYREMYRKANGDREAYLYELLD